MDHKLPPVIRDICGEYKGWNAHQRNGESQCGLCRKAAAEYKREHRHSTGFSKSTLYTAAAIEEIKRSAVREFHRTTLTRRASRMKHGKRVMA